MCFSAAVILHNASQIRLELTAEDIQLDCSCHSVASIRVSPDAFVFAVATREKKKNTAHCLFVSFPFTLTSSSHLLHYFIIECYMLNIDITGACKCLIYIVHFSDVLTLSDLKSPSALR